MEIRRLRIEKGWSQEQLATISGVSTRTIQRMEQGKKAGLESLKSIAAVFDLDIKDIAQPKVLNNISNYPIENNSTKKEVILKRKLSTSILLYLAVNGMFLILNLIYSPDYLWVKWPLLGWGIPIILRLLRHRNITISN